MDLLRMGVRVMGWKTFMSLELVFFGIGVPVEVVQINAMKLLSKGNCKSLGSTFPSFLSF